MGKKCRTFLRQMKRQIAQTELTQRICEESRVTKFPSWYMVLMIMMMAIIEQTQKTLLIFNPNYPIQRRTRSLLLQMLFLLVMMMMKMFFVLVLPQKEKCRILLKIDLNLKLSIWNPTLNLSDR